MRDDKLVIYLLKLAIVLQPLLAVLPRTPLIEVKCVKVIAKAVRCVKYFISYEL